MGEAAPRLNSRCHVANGILWILAKCRSDIRAHRFTYWFQAVPRISRWRSARCSPASCLLVYCPCCLWFSLLSATRKSCEPCKYCPKKTAPPREALSSPPSARRTQGLPACSISRHVKTLKDTARIDVVARLKRRRPWEKEFLNTKKEHKQWQMNWTNGPAPSTALGET